MSDEKLLELLNDIRLHLLDEIDRGDYDEEFDGAGDKYASTTGDLINWVRQLDAYLIAAGVQLVKEGS